MSRRCWTIAPTTIWSSLCLDGDTAGMALVDVSTGEFSIYQFEDALSQLMSEFSRINPSEITPTNQRGGFRRR